MPVAQYEAYRATAQYVSPDGKTIQFLTGLTAGDPSTTAALHAVPAIARTEAAAVAKTLGATRVRRCRVILFIKIGGDSGLTFILPFLMFVFLLALGEDYNILVMSRIREEAHHLPLREAVSRAVGATGTTVTSAGLVLAGTFAVFALVGGRGSGGDQIRDIGVGLALGVLMDTFIVRTVLVPCTVILLGRWNWWPSALSRVGAQPGGPDGPGGPGSAGGPGGPGGEGTEQDTESATPRAR